MWGWWLAAAMAVEPEWVDTVTRALGQDSVFLSTEALRHRLQTHCATGVDAACTWLADDALLKEPNADALRRHLGSRCGEGEAVACLIVGWSLGQSPPGHYHAQHAEDGERAAEALRRSCDAGLPRGCVEVALAKQVGLGTYASAEQAETGFREGCRRQQGRACRELARLATDDSERDALLGKATSLGDAGARWALLFDESSAEQRAALAAEACDVGLRAACVYSAQHGPENELASRLGQACDLGEVTACARAALVSGSSLDERVAVLRDIGREWTPAAAWAELVASGVELPPFPSQQPPFQLEQEAMEYMLATAVHPCYQAAVATDGASGFADVALLVGASGLVEGAAVIADWASPSFRSCAAEEIVGVQIWSPASEPNVMTMRLGLDHEARIDVRQQGRLDDARDVTRLMPHVRDQWAEQLELCAVGAGDVPAIAEIELKVARSGRPASVELTDSTGVEAIDNCLIDQLGNHAESERLVGAVRLKMVLSLLQRAKLEDPPPESHRTKPWPPTDPPSVEEVLVLILAEHRADGRGARLPAKSVASIEAAHAAAADWVHEHSGGALRLHNEVRVVNHALLRELGEGERRHRWVVTRDDLPPDLIKGIEPGRYDTIYLWAPIPRGMPQPNLGVVWGGETLRGAGFVTLGLASGREFLLPEGQPPSLAVLAGHYTLWRERALDLLGVELPPNTRILERRDGERFDPRLGYSDEPQAFYEQVFYNELRPQLWHDLTTWGDDLNAPTPGNLAYTAEAMASPHVQFADYLNDAVVDRGAGWSAAIDDSDEFSAWFGLMWDAPVNVDRIRALLPRADGAPPPIVEVQVWIDEAWATVQIVDAAPTALEVAFSPTATTGLRLVVTTPSPRLCTELEVFGPQ